jgi:hypothetical protein
MNFYTEKRIFIFFKNLLTKKQSCGIINYSQTGNRNPKKSKKKKKKKKKKRIGGKYGKEN